MLYEFNEQTGEYIMEMPFETQKTSNRTDIKPPKTKETEVAVFNRELQEWEFPRNFQSFQLKRCCFQISSFCA